ncbi:hypothetical protein AGMMS49944_18160 [Spirochaetia bacterium]|nr:hypothetical protein AGMMS49944_18160 [Spirochaetia bacterium]
MRGSAPRFSAFLFVSLISLAGCLVSCGAETVLGLPRDEAASRLKKGDITFILDGPPEAMGELIRLHVSAPYYAGLLVKARGPSASGNEARATVLFETSLIAACLDGKDGRLQREAAGELMRFLLEWDVSEVERFLGRLEGKGRSLLSAPAIRSLRAACFYRLGRFADIEELYAGVGDRSPWDRAFMLLAVGEGSAADFFLGDASLEEARPWALEEFGDRLAETAGVAEAAAGHAAMVRSAYGEGLAHFRATLAADEGLFFRYPALVGELGRAFQFGSAPKEGLTLFLDWDVRLPGDKPELRYLVLYYAGRIQRQLRQYDQAAVYFDWALDFAPDALQADACIWYILSMSFQEQPGETAALIGNYITRWHQDDYFADILDRLARYLVAKRRWDTLAEVFSLIEPRSDGATIAKYAYILGRAVSEGLIKPAPRPAEDYFRIALERGNTSFYYRAMAASRLGATVIPIPADQRSVDQKSDDLNFLLGFFEYGAAGLAYDFIKDDTDRFSPAELRTLAAAFAAAEHWEESIRVVTAYAGRAGYVMNKQDLVLYYPRAFADLVEPLARDADIPEELLFGLIRTESAFAPGIRSRVGAVGLTQLMPATAEEMADRIRRRGGPNYAEDGKLHLEDPAVNIHLGAVYLRYLMDRTESPMMALLAYNGGMGRLRRWRNAEAKLPGDLFLETIEYNETREYGRKVLSAAAAYGYLYYDMTMEAVLADTW